MLRATRSPIKRTIKRQALRILSKLSIHFTITKSEDELNQPIGGGKEPTSVTFLYDSFNQEEGKYIARFNWVTPTTTKTTATLLC